MTNISNHVGNVEINILSEPDDREMVYFYHHRVLNGLIGAFLITDMVELFQLRSNSDIVITKFDGRFYAVPLTQFANPELIGELFPNIGLRPKGNPLQVLTVDIADQDDVLYVDILESNFKINEVPQSRIKTKPVRPIRD